MNIDPVYPDGTYPCSPPSGAIEIDVDSVGGPETALGIADGTRVFFVRFGPRLYPIVRTLVLNSETYLCGIAGSTVLQLAPGSNDATILSSVANVHDVTINGITFDGNKSKQSQGGAGVQLIQSHSAHVINVRAQNFRGALSGGVAFYLQAAEAPVIEHSFFLNNGIAGELGSDGLYVSGSGAQIRNNFAGGNSDTGFATQNSHDMLFEYNLARRNGNGFAAGAPSYNLTYRRNTSEANEFGFFFCPCNSSPASHDVAVDSSYVLNNSAEGIYVYGLPQDMPTNYALIGNTVSQSSGAGVLPEGVNGIFLKYVQQSQLLDNTVQTNDNHGVLIIGSSGIQLAKNSIWDNSQAEPCAAYGIYVKDDLATPIYAAEISIVSNTVFDNQLSPTQGRGIVVSAKDSATIAANKVFGNCQSTSSVVTRRLLKPGTVDAYPNKYRPPMPRDAVGNAVVRWDLISGFALKGMPHEALVSHKRLSDLNESLAFSTERGGHAEHRGEVSSSRQRDREFPR
jgi:parallel beta-helix repeat protein